MKGGQIQTRQKEEIFYNESDETLEQIAQRGNGVPIPGNIQGQVGRGSRQPALVEDVSAYCRGLSQMTSKGSFRHKAFCDPVVHSVINCAELIQVHFNYIVC